MKAYARTIKTNSNRSACFRPAGHARDLPTAVRTGSSQGSADGSSGSSATDSKGIGKTKRGVRGIEQARQANLYSRGS